MNKKRSGFIIVECILSLAIISLAVYVISSSLQDNYFIVNHNASKLEMLNIAKSDLQNLKYAIKNGKYSENYKETKEISSYKITTTIEKQEKYYQCYKVNVEVKMNTESIDLSGYVFQQ